MSSYQSDFEFEEIEGLFSRLEILLKRQELPTTAGKRQVPGDEFMLMGIDKDSRQIQFKHRISRQYVMVSYGTGIDILDVRGANYPESL